MNKNFQKVLRYALCVIYSIAMFFKLLWTVVQNGLNVFQVQVQASPPPILNDKRWGSHCYTYLKKQGLKIHYVEKGNRSKPLLLCLHGFPECWFSWRHQLEEFSSEYWVVAIDTRGYGDSDKPKGKAAYRIEILVEDIREFISESGKSKCLLMTHDWGGGVGWVLVDKYPELIERHISLNGCHRAVFLPIIYSNLKQFAMSWYIFFFQAPWLPEIILRLQNLQSYSLHMKTMRICHEDNIDEVLEAYKYYYSQKDAFTPPINYYRSSFEFDESQMKSTIEVPTMIIWGELDSALSQLIPHKTIPLCTKGEFYLVKNAGHFVHQDKPKEVNTIIWKYLKSTH